MTAFGQISKTPTFSHLIPFNPKTKIFLKIPAVLLFWLMDLKLLPKFQKILMSSLWDI